MRWEINLDEDGKGTIKADGVEQRFITDLRVDASVDEPVRVTVETTSSVTLDVEADTQVLPPEVDDALMDRLIRVHELLYGYARANAMVRSVLAMLDDEGILRWRQ